jgi:hypothetical protein
MATTRGKGTDTPADAPRARRTRTRAPEDDISGVAAPEAAAPPARRTRRAAPGTGAADGSAAEAPRPTRRKASEAPAAETAKPKKRGGQRETYAETAARRKKAKEVDQLQADLRAFAQARPGGWNHDDWVAFLADLGTRGHDVSDAETIGSRLEQERLAVVLGAVQGLGPKRVQSLVERFHTLWSIRHADAGEVAAVPGMTRPLAERVVEQLRAAYA